MKRNPRKLKWTKAFRKAAGKEMTVDTTLLFAARRNVPVRYNRELVAKTVKAMERISEIRARRERVFYKRRMRGNRQRELQIARKLVSENEHLLPKLRGSEKKRLAEAGLNEEEIAQVEGERQTSKVFGKELRRKKVVQIITEDGIEERTEDVVDTVWQDEDEDAFSSEGEGEDEEGDVEMLAV
jgi:large subunit ribosomal protein L24e